MVKEDEFPDSVEPEVVAKQKSPTLDRYQGMESTNFENFINQNNNEFESTYNSVDYSNKTYNDSNKKSRNNNFRNNNQQQPSNQRRTRWDVGASNDPQPSTSSNNTNPNNILRGTNNFNINHSVNSYSGYNGFNCASISNPKLQPINGNIPPVRKVYDPQVDGDCSVTEVKLQFKHLCHCQLKYGNCGRLRAGNCQYNHTIPNKLIYIYMESEQEIKQILDHAISNGFLGYLASVFEKSITKFDGNSILLVLKNILSLLPTEQVRFYLDASIRVLLQKNKTLAFIANNLAEQVVQILIQYPRLETLPTLVMDAISEKISRGAYWDTLKKFFTLMPRVEPARVAIVLQESLDFKKSLVHNSEVNQMILDMFDSVRDEIDQTLLADFNNNFEDQQRQHNAEIASPSPDRRDNSPPRVSLGPPLIRLVLPAQDDLLPPGVVFEAPRRIEERPSPVGESSTERLDLQTIDRVPPPESVYRNEVKEFHRDIDELRTALLTKNYPKIIIILNKYKMAQSIENAQPFSRGFYRILCTEVMTPEHTDAIIERTAGEFITVTTVENTATISINYSR
ncbi:GSCOCG00013564001-RA-CDS [Cotesia congregata]|nr:GSCOCG00013564001-RA-CDS [Cotesia congregata]